jgi:cysteinyl-tRNA synthetase
VLLQAHYRSPVRVDRDTIDAAVRSLGRLDGLARRAAGVADSLPDESVLDAFSTAMDDDLDTPRAMAVVFDAVTRANAALDAGDAAKGAALVAAVFATTEAVGLGLKAPDDDVPSEVVERVRALDAARAAKDFTTADLLRAALHDDGWVVETGAGGTSVRRR